MGAQGRGTCPGLGVREGLEEVGRSRAVVEGVGLIQGEMAARTKAQR